MGSIDEQVRFCPPELVSYAGNGSEALYHRYLIELHPAVDSDILPHDIILATRTRLECYEETLKFDLDADRCRIIVQMKYAGNIRLDSEEVLLCQEFQVTVFKVLLDRNLKKLREALGRLHQNNECFVFDYLILPANGSCQNPSINWEYVKSVQFCREDTSNKHVDGCAAKGRGRYVHTMNGLVCSCTLKNCLVLTPHNGFLYCITGTLENLNSNSMLELGNGESISYASYFKRKRPSINLRFVGECLLRGKPMFTVKNYLYGCRNRKEKGPSKSWVELPPELCSVIMSPISVASFYTFSLAPSIMHRIESFLLAANLKRLLVDHRAENAVIPTMKVLEAITTENCQENFHLESLEALGDSYLKYATSQQLFKTYQNHREGLLSANKEKIIANASLCKLGCERKISGFILDEPFDPKLWIIPGYNSGTYSLEKDVLSAKRMVYVVRKRKMESKTVADVIEALIGAFLNTGDEVGTLMFMRWLGIEVDFIYVPYSMPLSVNPEELVNVKCLEALLKYKFRDASLLVEALTHGSCITKPNQRNPKSRLPVIPRSYQRLEFLGDAVLDYIITEHLYFKHPELSPGLLTDLRSAMVNNDCYSQSAVKAGLHKHILLASQDLQLRIDKAVHHFEQSCQVATLGWDSEVTFPKVLGDLMESLAGAIFIDSGYNKEIVFQTLRPLLEPMITPETVKLHPVSELYEICQRENYIIKESVVLYENDKVSVTIEVKANGVTHKSSRSAASKETAKKLACKDLVREFSG